MLYRQVKMLFGNGKMSPWKVGLFIATGLLLGCVTGLMFIGTLHAMLEIGVKKHHGETAIRGRMSTGGDAAGRRKHRAQQNSALPTDTVASTKEAAHQSSSTNKSDGDASSKLLQPSTNTEESDRARLMSIEENEIFLKRMADDPFKTTHESQPARIHGRKPIVIPTAESKRTDSSAHPKRWKTGNTIHTIVTSNGSPYQNWQTRIMYATYKLVQKMEGGDKMVAFTRILHRSTEDELMEEISTFRTNPRNPMCDIWCEYPVADRSAAVTVFFKAALLDNSLIKAPWVLLTEADIVWMKPLSAPKAESSVPSVGYLFDYIIPAYPGIQTSIRKLFPESEGPTSLIPQSGPAPVLMRVQDWMTVAPEWTRVTKAIEADHATVQQLGWVREMYAFSIAVALKKIPFSCVSSPSSSMISQPPDDETLGNAAMIHYTWASVIQSSTGAEIWKFDKRQYIAQKYALQVPQMQRPPPYRSDMVLPNSTPLTKELWRTMDNMITQMNRGSSTLKKNSHRNAVKAR